MREINRSSGRLPTGTVSLPRLIPLDSLALMRVLFVFRHRKSAEPFVTLIGRQLGDGHTMRVALQEHNEKVRKHFSAAAQLTFSDFVSGRGDEWATGAPFIRRSDAAHRRRRPARAVDGPA